MRPVSSGYLMKPKILTTLPETTRESLIADVWAGVTVALVALPLSIAIAIASGAEPAQGLVTAIVAGFVISALGGSRVQIGGPTGAFIVVVAGVIAVHGYDGLVLATFMAGLILLAAGFLRAGNLISFVPEPVVDGFTVGIAIIIATSQLKDALGLRIEAVPADFLEKVPVLLGGLKTVVLARARYCDCHRNFDCSPAPGGAALAGPDCCRRTDQRRRLSGVAASDRAD